MFGNDIESGVDNDTDQSSGCKKTPMVNEMTPILSVVLEGDRMVLKYDDHGNESGVELELVNALN